MKKILYDWNTNTIDYRDKHGNHYFLQLRGNKNIIKGSSGTGKSYLYNKISKMKQRLDNTALYNVENIFVLNKDNMDKLSTLKDKFIIIDNAELLLDDITIDFIDKDDNNRYLIFARVPLDISISPNHQADLVTENGSTVLKYRFNIKGWC